MNTETERGPTFIGIGGMKCGSTWLSECLRYHPQIFMSAPKEIHFFGSANTDRDIGWYLEHFKRSDGYKAVGEFSASYLQRPTAAEHIKNSLGQVKIVVILRDPVERFISHYKQFIRKGLLPRNEYSVLDANAFFRAVDLYPKLLGHGDYYRNLVRFTDFFGSGNVCVVLKEAIDKNPRSELEKVYDFLEVEQDYVPPVLNKQVSPGIVPRFPLLETLRGQLFRSLNKTAPQFIVYSRKFRLGEIYRRLNSDNRPDHFKVTSDVVQKLYAYYRDETHRLEQVLGRDLALWKR